MKHLLIDCTFLVNELKRKRPPHGLPRVTLAYLRNYQETLQLVYRVRRKLFILSRPQSQKIIQLLVLWDFQWYKTIIKLLVKGIMCAEKIHPNHQYFLLKIDQNGIKYPAYFKQIKSMGIKPLIMIHDLFPITYPEYSDPNYAIGFENTIQTSIANASGLICVSHNTQQDLTQYIQRSKLTSPPTIAAPLAPGLLSNFPQKPRPIEGPYFVIISTIVARKNHLMLLQIWRKLVDEYGEKAPHLVIIGKRSSECSNTIALLERCQQLKQKVLEITATDEEMHHYLAHANALLFPTFAEGYGLPLIEALSINVPVIASDLPIFREIAQDIPEYLQPFDGLGWMQKIIDYTQAHSMQREAQLKRLTQFSIPSWEEHFNKVDIFLDELS